ncbi:MAG: hypothetical protein WCP96_18270 [Methylococcaceae bacterium]
MIVFSNTTPIIVLSSIQCLHLLPQLFGEIHLVNEVIDECAAGGQIAVPSLLEISWIKQVCSTPIQHNSVLLELDKVTRNKYHPIIAWLWGHHQSR